MRKKRPMLVFGFFVLKFALAATKWLGPRRPLGLSAVCQRVTSRADQSVSLTVRPHSDLAAPSRTSGMASAPQIALAEARLGHRILRVNRR